MNTYHHVSKAQQVSLSNSCIYLFLNNLSLHNYQLRAHYINLFCIQNNDLQDPARYLKSCLVPPLAGRVVLVIRYFR